MSGIIPITPGDPEQRIGVSLDDRAYVFRVRWNTRDDEAGAWYLDIFDEDGTTRIASGLKLVLGVRLGRRIKHPLFDGALFLVDDSGTGREAGLFDLGGRVTLWYLDPGDRLLAGDPVLPIPAP